MRNRLLLASVAAAVTAAVLLLSVGGCGRESAWPNQPGPKVVVSFPPLYCFAKAVAGDDAAVRCVMSTTGPHDFNPTEVEARLLREADLFFVNGLGLDDGVAETLQKGSGNRRLKRVKLGDLIPEKQLLEGECHHDHDHAGPHVHPTDPHVWLSPDLAVVMVNGVRDELKAADPAHAAGYDRRAAEYVAKLRQLKADGAKLLADEKDRKLVTFHESLGYLAAAFDLEIAGVVQKRPGVEPNAKELEELVAMCQQRKVRLIAVEPQYTANTSAKTVLDELKRKGIADAALVEVDPLETAHPSALTPDWYEARLRANLDALSRAMK
ncbi:MAG: metal ABC transporter substrate-binding protein [Gemmataceae bacterium]|nr:metal ABC transporter substrate-binding protein [Gemmataceae bacterium]